MPVNRADDLLTVLSLMSAANEDRSRTGRRGNESKSANQQRQTAAFRDGTPSSQQVRKGGKASQNISKHQEATSNGPIAAATATPTQPEEHVPLPGFKPPEVETTMKKNFDNKAPTHKSDAKSTSTGSDSPWGTKPGVMANGKDFWLELRKQVTSLQQSGGTGLGG